MIITINLMGIITSAILFVWAQIMKFISKKYNFKFVSNYLPIIILVVSYIVYLIELRTFVDPIVNALVCTAMCCYAFDLYKAIKTLIQNIISKIRTKSSK